MENKYKSLETLSVFPRKKATLQDLTIKIWTVLDYKTEAKILKKENKRR